MPRAHGARSNYRGRTADDRRVPDARRVARDRLHRDRARRLGLHADHPAALRAELTRRDLTMVGHLRLGRVPRRRAARGRRGLCAAVRAAARGGRRRGRRHAPAGDPLRVERRRRGAHALRRPDHARPGVARRRLAGSRRRGQPHRASGARGNRPAGRLPPPLRGLRRDARRDRPAARPDRSQSRRPRLRHRALPLWQWRIVGRRCRKGWSASGPACGTSTSRTATALSPRKPAPRAGTITRRCAMASSANSARARSTSHGRAIGSASSIIRAGSSSSRTCWPGWGRPRESARRNRQYLASIGL